ncbi:MAG: GIY-YIG nuclease family protein [Pseudomonadota bacterium]|nr:GIY-YIG nuclease family protein [Pseudomonadota bacterium]
MKNWSIYILRCNDNSLYIGITLDIERRMKEHSSSKRGAKYLKGKQPLELIFLQKIGNKGTALKIEYHLKQLTKKKKEILVSDNKKLRAFILNFIDA